MAQAHPVLALPLQASAHLADVRPVAALLQVTPQLLKALAHANGNLEAGSVVASVPVDADAIRFLTTVAITSDGALGSLDDFAQPGQFVGDALGYQLVANLPDDAVDWIEQHEVGRADLQHSAQLVLQRPTGNQEAKFVLLAGRTHSIYLSPALPMRDLELAQRLCERIEATCAPSLADVTAQLQAIVDDADDTGCDGMHTVNSSLIRSAAVVLSRLAQAGDVPSRPSQAPGDVHAAADALLNALYREYPEGLPLYCRGAADALRTMLEAQKDRSGAAEGAALDSSSCLAPTPERQRGRES